MPLRSAGVNTNKKIVVIGGGTGVFTALTGLKKHFKNLTAVVAMSDGGGSTGILREEFGILPPGDIRKALVALASSDSETLSKLFNYRFKEGSGFSGHSFGNLMITALERMSGNFEKAVEDAGKLLKIEGRVLPVTLSSTSLMAELENGKIIKGEGNIDIPKHDGNLKIKKIWLKPNVTINPTAKKAILSADAIVIGPGDLYTSIVPNLLVKGMRQALRQARGKKIYFVNLMTKFGETNGFRVSDFAKTIEQHLGKKSLNYIVANKNRPSTMRFRPYSKEKSQFVEIDTENIKDSTLVTADLIRKYGFVRHDPDKLAGVVKMLV